MFKEILAGMAGVHVYPVVSLILFVAVFAVVLLRVARMDGAAVQRLAALPLERDKGTDVTEAAVAR